MIWLWTMLLRAPAGQHHTTPARRSPSPSPSFAAVTAATLRPGLTVQIAQKAVPGADVAQYVPSTQRAQQELGLRTLVPLDEAIRRTAAWHGYKL